MKKLLLLLAITIMSCSTDEINDDTCACEKETYNIEQGTAIDLTTGLPYLTFTHVLISTEAVVCQNEGQFQLEDNFYYIIKCD